MPRWAELPSAPLSNEQLVQLVEEILFPLLHETRPLTTTMVQNYVKWKNMPGPIGKKYRTMHITWALVITLLKKVLTIPEIELGIELQLRIQPLEAAYDNFCEILETALFSSCSPLLALDETYEFTAQTIRTEFVATFTVCQALAYKLLTERIITCNGFAQNHRLFTLGQSPQISNRGESHA